MRLLYTMQSAQATDYTSYLKIYVISTTDLMPGTYDIMEGMGMNIAF